MIILSKSPEIIPLPKTGDFEAFKIIIQDKKYELYLRISRTYLAILYSTIELERGKKQLTDNEKEKIRKEKAEDIYKEIINDATAQGWSLNKLCLEFPEEHPYLYKLS